MITGFLLSYALCTSALIGVGILRVRRSKKEAKEKQPLTPNTTNGALTIIKEAFTKAGLVATIEEVPTTPEAAIVLMHKDVTENIRGFKSDIMRWILFLQKKAEDNKRDMDALMQAVAALTKAEIDKREKGVETPDKSKDQFAAYFEFVREKFPMTATEKKVINKIISNLRSDSYGAKQ